MHNRADLIMPDLQNSQVGKLLHFSSDFHQLVLQLLLLNVQLLQPALEGSWVFTSRGSSCCCPVQLHKLLLVALHLLIQLLDVLVLCSIWWDLQLTTGMVNFGIMISLRSTLQAAAPHVHCLYT